MHLECFRELLFHDGFFYPSGILKPIMLTPSFFTYVHSDAIKTMEWLKQLLIQEKLWIDGQFLFENMLIPACIKNSHWILIHINVWNQTCFPINPYHPTEPHQGDFDHCHTLIETISQHFNLPNLFPSMPTIITQLPPQIQETINCGVFIAVFCLAMIETNLQSTPDFLTIDEYRFLMVVWFLTKSKPSLSTP